MPVMKRPLALYWLQLRAVNNGWNGWNEKGQKGLACELLMKVLSRAG